MVVLLHKWEFKNIEVEFLKVSKKFDHQDFQILELGSPGTSWLWQCKHWDKVSCSRTQHYRCLLGPKPVSQFILSPLYHMVSCPQGTKYHVVSCPPPPSTPIILSSGTRYRSRGILSPLSCFGFFCLSMPIFLFCYKCFPNRLENLYFVIVLYMKDHNFSLCH